MPALTASRRAVAATALGIVVSLALVGCAPVADLRRGPGQEPRVDASIDPVGCSLLFIDGQLAAENGRMVLNAGESFVGPPWDRPVPLDWPEGWTVGPVGDGELEVVDVTGTVRARTGEGIVLSAVGDPATGGSLFRDGELVVCPGEWPDNYLDPDYVAPDPDAP